MNKSINWFCIVYYIFLLICVFYPQYPLVGGISVRHIMTVLMLILSFSKRNFFRDWFVILYALFLLFYLLSGFLTGFPIEHIYKLFGTYLAAVVMYCATRIMISDYRQTKMLSIVLLVIFGFDAVVSIGQYFQVPGLIHLPEVLGINVEQDFVDKLDDFITMDGIVLQGLVGGVMNGYILSAATVLAWYPFKKKNAPINFLFWILCLVASFYTQERSGFYLAIICAVVMLFFKMQKKNGSGLVLLILLFIILVVFGSSLYDLLTSTGRYQFDVSGNRDRQFYNGFTFFINNPFGGDALYNQFEMSRPHNIILNMLVVGGIFGGITLIVVFVKQMYLIIKYLLRPIKSIEWPAVIYCIMYLNFTANSFVHNASIVYGSILFFVFWGVVSSLIESQTNQVVSFSKQ